MFGKSDLIDSLSRDLSRARINAIPLLPMSRRSLQRSPSWRPLSAENDWRERQRVWVRFRGSKSDSETFT